MLELEIKNFQSIESIRLSVEGFTALTGRSNVGKSSIIRAVKYALSGASGTSFVRHGPGCERVTKGSKHCKCFSSVRVLTEGIDILWEKGDQVNRYTVNGEIFDRVDRGAPEFLAKWFDPIKLGDSHQLIQVADQFRPIFLLDLPGSVAADVVADASRLDRINTAIRLAEKDRREAVASRKAWEEDQVRLTNRLLYYDGMDPILERAGQVTEALDDLEDLDARVGRLSRLVLSLTSCVERAKALETVSSYAVPDIGEVEGVKKRVVSLGLLMERLSGAVRSVQVASALEGLDLPDLPGLTGTSAKLIRLSGQVAKIRSAKTWHQTAKEATEVSLPPLEEAHQSQDRLTRLARFHDRVLSLQQEADTLEKEAEGAEQETKAADQELGQLGVCPTCARPLGPGHIHV